MIYYNSFMVSFYKFEERLLPSDNTREFHTSKYSHYLSYIERTSLVVARLITNLLFWSWIIMIETNFTDR